MGILDLLGDSSLCRYIIAYGGFGATDVFRESVASAKGFECTKAKQQRDVGHSCVVAAQIKCHRTGRYLTDSLFQRMFGQLLNIKLNLNISHLLYK